MDEIEAGLKDFLNYWFAGCMGGIEELDESSQRKVLHACGRACAESYTIQKFRETKEASPDLDTFLENLSKGPEAKYERIGPRTIKATYSSCGCDLVRLGLVKSPVLCECSAANLAENLRGSLGVEASVTVESSILREAEQCVLIATLEEKA